MKWFYDLTSSAQNLCRFMSTWVTAAETTRRCEPPDLLHSLAPWVLWVGFSPGHHSPPLTQLISAADAARDAGKQCLLVTALQVCYDHTSWLVHIDGGAQKWILFVACVHGCMCAGVYARTWTCIWMPEDDLQGRCFLLETGSLTVLGIAKQTRLAGHPAQVIQPSLVSISLALGLWL